MCDCEAGGCDSAMARAVASAEIDALLRSPSPCAWLDLEAPHDTQLAPLDLDQSRQRGRGPRHAKLAWRWSCSVRAPEGSPYAGESYRLLVRFPLGYPSLAPRVHVLSVVHHIEVNLRDPDEGQIEELVSRKQAASERQRPKKSRPS